MRGRCFVSVGFPWVMSSGAFGIVAFRSAKVRGARVLFRGAKGYYGLAMATCETCTAA